MGVGGLGVINPAHPAPLPHQGTAMGSGAKGTGHPLHRVRWSPRLQRGRAGRRQVHQVRRVIDCQLRKRYRGVTHAQGVALHSGSGRRQAQPAHRHQSRRRPCGRRSGAGIVGVIDEHVVGRLVAEDVGLGRGIGIQRAVPVQVVGSDVEQHRHRGMELLAETKLEARQLHDRHIHGLLGHVR